jgi:hypothetical protein
LSGFAEERRHARRDRQQAGGCLVPRPGRPACPLIQARCWLTTALMWSCSSSARQVIRGRRRRRQHIVQDEHLAILDDG